MFLAMNRFKVKHGSEEEFEAVWRQRDSYLQRVPGFVAFNLLRGPSKDDHTLYASHSVWRERADFEAWTRSEEFRMAHRSAGGNKPLYIGHPEVELFESVIAQQAGEQAA
ncbi:Heme oxygenase (staphylobilin-producing) [Starkeya nomas]|uniref:Heme oxygenase (Staphylobilin-producing) n=2 Tax=Xanthobacteraceae TaxID=335928 RepID=A0A5S9NMG6_9HYPH|nr:MULTISPECIES: antibiotic biosynthesis monooxygenase [Xanthobacteraceae]TSJ61522.1 antibiotic biosynthesis monooxygenase [Ancylobacter moscoviensis]CAA0091653.1 Heme oxygenase (staphylobilin-producing) [Starkeya nomas]